MHLLVRTWLALGSVVAYVAAEEVIPVTPPSPVPEPLTVTSTAGEARDPLITPVAIRMIYMWLQKIFVIKVELF